MSHPRRTKLIRRSFQTRLITKFVGVAALALVLQFLLLGFLLSSAVRGVEGSTDVFEAIPGVVLKTLGFSLVVLLPVMFGMGVLLTHRIAGPITRFEHYLAALADGENDGYCRTRPGDELGDLRDVINRVTSRIEKLEGVHPPIIRKAS